MAWGEMDNQDTKEKIVPGSIITPPFGVTWGHTIWELTNEGEI